MRKYVGYFFCNPRLPNIPSELLLCCCFALKGQARSRNEFHKKEFTAGGVSSDHCWWICRSGGDLSDAPTGCSEDQLSTCSQRFQIQRGASDPNSYKGLGDCFRTIFRNEGVYGFYKGILPPILAETPKRAVKFFTFEQYKKLLSFTPLSQGMALSVAGLGSGLTEALVVNPFEVVKVSLQANRDSFQVQPSTFSQARMIINADGFGLRGLNKGLTSTLGRHGVFNMIYFGFYFNVKDAIPASQDPRLEFMRKFAIGLLSGTISSCVNIPFDVAKSRIQGPQPVPGEIKYRSCFQTMALVYREEGYLALYKGLIPKVMRLGPGGAVMLLVYEYVSGWLQRNW
ncbi:mitochondrial 2-oxodicarboxylate carrier isoform X2 [Salminus brasiliensis]|uniref:mitochondrial 2-oxodicarboxylate carrier isoform X2 n=1 Tax=Salminus brasiliensis TaxID=930266 RepID=UPI003B82FE8F